MILAAVWKILGSVALLVALADGSTCFQTNTAAIVNCTEDGNSTDYCEYHSTRPANTSAWTIVADCLYAARVNTWALQETIEEGEKCFVRNNATLEELLCFCNETHCNGATPTQIQENVNDTVIYVEPTGPLSVLCAGAPIPAATCYKPISLPSAYCEFYVTRAANETQFPATAGTTGCFDTARLALYPDYPLNGILDLVPECLEVIALDGSATLLCVCNVDWCNVGTTTQVIAQNGNTTIQLTTTAPSPEPAVTPASGKSPPVLKFSTSTHIMLLVLLLCFACRIS